MYKRQVSEITQAALRDDIPDFRPGDSVKVHVKVVEGNRSRIQVFAGNVIARNGSGIAEACLLSTSRCV